MKKSLKTRMVSIAMACFMVATSTCGVASATTVRNRLVYGDKWVFNTSIIRGTYNSSYTAKKPHYTSVRNNKSGQYNQSYGGSHCTAKASVTANWFGPDGTARIWLA